MQGAIIDGRWELLKSIGRGGMGEVFVARHTTLETTVALKLLKPELSQDASIREKMITEAKAAAKVRHPNVVVVSDVGQTKEGSVFIVMEHVDGDDLKTLLDREGPLSIPRARSLLVQIASGLVAAHASNVLHRDIKPANCVVATIADDTEVVKLLDFGIAKILEDKNDTARDNPTTNRWFTRHYVAPEVERGHPSSERSDLYSFGVLAYRMLTGHYPYERSFKSITPPEHYRPELPCDLCELMRDMLQPDPDDRPLSMARVCQRLVLECPSGSFSGPTLPDERVSDTAPDPRTVPRGNPRRSARWSRWALVSGLLGACVPIVMAWTARPLTLEAQAEQPTTTPPDPPQDAALETPSSSSSDGDEPDQSLHLEPPPNHDAPKRHEPENLQKDTTPTSSPDPAEPPVKPPVKPDWNKRAKQLVSKYLKSRCHYDGKVTISITMMAGNCLAPVASVASSEAKACIESALSNHKLRLPDGDYEDIVVQLSP